METVIYLKGPQGLGTCEVSSWLALPDWGRGAVSFLLLASSMTRKQPEVMNFLGID